MTGGGSDDGEDHHSATPGGAGDGKVNTRQFRLVVRNLPFSIKESAVRAAFEEFGSLEEVHVPTKTGRDGKPMGRGFGFVQYSKKKEAKDAVEKGNGMQVLGRPVAVDWALGKELYVEVAGPPKKQGEKKGGLKGAKEGAADAGKGKGKMEGGDVSKGEEEGGEGGGKAVAEAPKSKKRKVEAEKEEGGGGGSKLETTVFLRNIPLEATEKDVASLMGKFGRFLFCRLVIDKTSGRHKGTAFVKYVERSSAEAAVAKGCPFTGSEEWEKVQKKRDKKAAKGHLKAQLENDQKDILSLFGRLLFCAFAVDRKSAEKLQGQEIKKDRRNLYLAKEGLILEGSSAAENTPPADLAKRLRAWQEKKTKLANTNFFINPTRLSVRNVGKDVTEADLKKAFAVAAQGSTKAGDVPVKVVQARLVLDKEKLDPVTGKGTSKGYGFVEFSNTDHAIAALRKLNNCPIAAKKYNGGKRLMIDFSIEDARIVRQREIKAARLERTRAKRAEAKKEDEAELGKPLGRGAKQRLAKRVRAEEKDADKQHSAKRQKTATQRPPQKSAFAQKTTGPLRGKAQQGEGAKKGVGRGAADKGEKGGAVRGGEKRKREEEFGDEEVKRALKGTEQRKGADKAKPKKGGKKEKNQRETKDDFEKLVQSYSSKLFGGQASRGGRWCD